MKKIIIIFLFLAFHFLSNAQVLTGKNLSLNGVTVNVISNDTTLSSTSPLTLYTAYAIKNYLINHPGGTGGGGSDGNNYTTSIGFSGGTFTENRSGLSPLTQSLDGRWVKISDTAAAFLAYLRGNVAAATYVPLTRTITIDGTSLDLSTNRSFTTNTFYNINGTFGANRTVTGADKFLTIYDLKTFQFVTRRHVEPAGGDSVILNIQGTNDFSDQDGGLLLESRLKSAKTSARVQLNNSAILATTDSTNAGSIIDVQLNGIYLHGVPTSTSSADSVLVKTAAGQIKMRAQSVFGGGGGGSQSLDDVTTIGNTTTNDITVNSVNIGASAYAVLYNASGLGALSLKNGSFYSLLRSSSLTASRTQNLPDASGTVALRAADSTSSPINMIYQGLDGLFHKAAVPAGGGSDSAILVQDHNLLKSTSGTNIILKTNKVPQVVSDASTITVNVNNGSNFITTGIAGNHTLSYTNIENGDFVQGILKATSTDRTLTLPGGGSVVVPVNDTLLLFDWYIDDAHHFSYKLSSGGASGSYVAVDGSTPLTGNWNVGAHNIASTQSSTTAATVNDGFKLINTTAASSGNQQYSPSVHFSGQGWKTASTAASQPIDFRMYVTPVQGSSNPSGALTIDYSVNGGSYTAGFPFQFATDGTFYATSVEAYGVEIQNLFGGNAITLQAPTSGSGTITFPGTTSTLATVALTETLTNKTLTTPVLNAPIITSAINTQTSSYTLVLTDQTKDVEMNVGSANNLTVPPNSSVAFPVGTQIIITQLGAGQTTIVAGSGVTIRSSGGKLKIADQYSGATLIKRATDEWVMFGNITN